MAKKTMAVIGMVVLALIISVLGWNILDRKNEESSPQEESAGIEKQEEEVVESKGITVAIDPGHGGYDPGKVGINGALEKDINLEISVLVKEALEEVGYTVVMTREEDVQVQDLSQSFSKTKDLDARVEIMNQEDIHLAISIHQNSYTAEEVKGAQVFYYEESKVGESMASMMQEALREVDPENHRQIKANNSYYLLKRTTRPTIIVECGFLSNMNEANMLIDMTYQKEMAHAIVNGVEKYVESL